MRSVAAVVWTVMVAVSAGSDAYADNGCSSVVQATLAEMRAGASDWTPEQEQLVRTAAGSACIKALSGRYEEGADMATEALPAASESIETEAVAGSDSAATEASAQGDSSDDDSVSIGGITFRPLSGSPAKKPFERQRDTDDSN